MRAVSKILALALTAALQPAVAGMISLDFEDSTTIAKIGNRYSGLGVNFTGDAWSYTSNQAGCSGLATFTRTGSCAGLLLAADAWGSSTSATRNFVIDVAEGFVTEFSFVFGLRSSAGVTIEIWDGVGGQGRLLNASALSGAPCATVRFCEWTSASMAFADVGRSVVVRGVDQRLMLDDLRFTTAASSPTRLPEPSGIALAMGALGALAWTRKRAAR